MSADDSDKTVFKPAVSGGNPDHTAIRPMPGGLGATPQPGARPQGRPAAPTNTSPAVDPEAAFFRATYGLNPIVSAASSLIAVFEKTRGSMSHPNIGGLHQRLANEIREFEHRLRNQGIEPGIVLAARYVMCSVLDESVLNTPWGSESAWGQRTLLSVFHKESSGGQKFFLILDRMRQSPSENIYMIELMYICLSLGFEGKYRIESRGTEAIEQIRDELFSIIRRHRGDYERSLADSWQGLGKTRNTLANIVPMWVIAVVAAFILFFSFSGFRWWLYKTSTPVAQELNTITIAAQEKLAKDKPEEKNTN